VVLGGRVAGTLAARVLADYYGHVVIIDRDEQGTRLATRRSPLPSTRAQTVPPDGLTRLQRMWPGLIGELIADGAAVIGRDHRGTAVLQATRSFFEYHLWRRSAAFDKITRLAGLDAVGLLAAEQRCEGVRVMSRTRGAAARTIRTDLVVDAMGMGSRLTRWLADTWHVTVPIEQSETAAHYLSRRYRLPSSSLAATRCGRSPDGRYGWMIMGVEDGDHVITVGGFDPGLEPPDVNQFHALACAALTPELAAVVRHGDPIADVCSSTRLPFQRRWFDRARGLPDGLLALGGSLHSTDPLHGMALSDALTEADLLDQALHGCDERSGRGCLTGRYFAAALST
jgi:flavin-dependent dehydrogenase